MQNIKQLLAFVLLALVVVACATSTITNLTPSVVPRNPTGQYLVEMKLDTTQQTMRTDTVTPYVIMGFNEYKMRPTAKMINRWETYIPVPADQDAVVYHFKVNYDYARFGKTGQGSKSSTEYKLTVK